MARTIEIYKRKDTTFIKEVINGTERILSSNKNRDFEQTTDGLIILPEDDGGGLNYFKINLSELVDDFGATTPEELHEVLRTNEYFKKGGGGVGGTFDSSFTTTITAFGVPVNTKVLVGDSVANFIKKMVVKYLASSFKSFSLNTPKTNPIAGETITISSATFSYNTDSNGLNPNSVAIFGLNFNVAIPQDTTNAVVSYVEDDETKNQISIAKNGGEIQQWILSGKDAEGISIANRTFRVTWYNQFLFGASPLVIDAINFQAILDSFSKSSLNGKYTTKTATANNNDGNNYTYIAYNNAYGNLINIIQNGATPVLGAFTKIGVFNWANPFGLIISTVVYKSNAKGAFGVDTKLAIS